jgi:hypothetical protein
MLQKTKSNQGWLIIIYRVPSIPSTSRVTIWKKVRELGAFLLQQSVYILPNLVSTKAAVDALKEQIQRLAGECKVLEIASLGEEQEKEVIAGFNNNREEEYTEVIKACKELLQEIDEESKTEDFHFADLEENEKHLQRVRELLDSVIERDYFESNFRSKATRMVKQCEEKFEIFSHEVFSREGVVSEEKKPSIILDNASKNKQKKSYNRKELIATLLEMIKSLNKGTLEVGTKKVNPLDDQPVLEWDYRVSKEENSLEIKVIWKSNSTI